jgi:hypothetical protein
MNTNSNINISQQNIDGTCDLKCAYNFKYQESSSTATNNGYYISLTYDNATIPPVLFNNQKYTVSTIQIVSPSIHTFNNVQTAAEIYIEHAPVSGGSNLFVCIPIVSSTDSSSASDLLTQIIQSVSSNAPSEGETTNLNIQGFTLDNIIPKKPFYTYNDSSNNNWIVFNVTSAIPISSSVLTSLSQIIQPYSFQTSGSNLFYNSKGPNTSGNSGNLGGGIYISCQPTGSSEEEQDVYYKKNQTSYDLASLMNNPTVILVLQIIIGGLIFIIVFFIFNYLYNYLTSDNIKLPNMNLLHS